MLDDLKELEKFFKLCRKQGVVDISLENIIVKFGDLPTKQTALAEEDFPTDEPTMDELIFHAVQNGGPL